MKSVNDMNVAQTIDFAAFWTEAGSDTEGVEMIDTFDAVHGGRDAFPDEATWREAELHFFRGWREKRSTLTFDGSGYLARYIEHEIEGTGIHIGQERLTCDEVLTLSPDEYEALAQHWFSEYPNEPVPASVLTVQAWAREHGCVPSFVNDFDF